MRDVVLVTVDSLRADHVGWQGYDRETTPNLDELADEARVFSRAFAHACSTRPSFPSILTSSYALMYGGFERLSADRTTLAEALSRGGYRTAGFHSNLYLSADFGYDRGFDAFYDSRTDPSVTAKARNAVKRNLDSDGLVYRTLQGLFNATEKRTGIEVGSPYVDAAELTDLALEWVRDEAEEGPRFLWVHYMDVHHPYVPPADYQRRFRDDPVSDRDAVQLRRKMLEAPEDVTDGERQTLLDLYDAEIAYVDREVDRLLEAVRSAWGDDTVVAFTADHGEEFADHGGFSHSATFYDEVLHVPFLLADGTSGEPDRTNEQPDGTSGESDDLVGLLDLAPTLVDCAGLARPDAFEGSSLLDDDFDRSEVIAEWADTDPESEARRYAIRSEDWKYVRLDDGTERLFALPSDPGERNDVVDAMPEVADEFRARLRDHRKLLAETNRDLGDVRMEEDVAERLRLLGYQE
ncbi:Arylsulfatase A [Halomicrobium zhouii]|uniref:Arylsulfatase A n=1 Tax=Halomicrobium zhouii TaxID=767519 RepID=A0A1I6M756_9EURY|nr:sulfatase [Halomicrobium zhouii]SFS11575.1 Arylsulfatase A [Halomicrobium zhouii]